jgi:uncharacterized protein YbbK (DUF523 family)
MDIWPWQGMFFGEEPKLGSFWKAGGNFKLDVVDLLEAERSFFVPNSSKRTLMTDHHYLQQLRVPSEESPLRVLVSACMIGIMCGVDGGNNGEYPSVRKLMTYPNVKLVPFCPEDYSFGTPRPMCDIHGGTGLDVLEGNAKVLTPDGEDWTEGLVRASEKMLAIAQDADVELAVMMDISAACGSQVIYDGNRYAENKLYQVGMGVCAAQLHRAGFKVISQRDFAALEILYSKIDPAHVVNPAAKDQNETDWYQGYFVDGKRKA